MNGTVVACTRDAKAAWPLLRQTVPVAQRLGCPVVSLNAWQVGIHTDSRYSGARIRRVETFEPVTTADVG